MMMMMMMMMMVVVVVVVVVEVVVVVMMMMMMMMMTKTTTTMIISYLKSASITDTSFVTVHLPWKGQIKLFANFDPERQQGPVPLVSVIKTFDCTLKLIWHVSQVIPILPLQKTRPVQGFLQGRSTPQNAKPPQATLRTNQ